MAFSDNIWWTRKSKIQTEKRLLANAFQSQILLLWYSFTAVAASVYYLKFSPVENDMAGIAWVVYSVLVLVMSGFINGLSFKQRASLIKECYETLSDVYQRVRHFEHNPSSKTTIEDLTAEYEQILGVCENHLTIDYFKALSEAYLTQTSVITTPEGQTSFKDDGLDRHPTKFVWFCVGLDIVKRGLMMTLFYLLPVILFLILEKLACQ